MVDLGSKRADLGPEGAVLRTVLRADLRSKRGPSSLRGRRTDRRRYERTSGNSTLCPTGHQPFGAAAQKVIEIIEF